MDRFHPLNAKLSQQLAVVEKCLSYTATGSIEMPQPEQDLESLSDHCSSPHDITNGHLFIPQPQLYSTPCRNENNDSFRPKRLVS